MRTTTMLGAWAAAVLTAGGGLAADIKVQAGDVKDSRTTGKFFNNLEVEVRFFGDDLEGAKGLRCTVIKAEDDTGRNLLLKEERGEKEFSELDSSNESQAQVTLKLKNPARKASTVKEISGTVEIFKPGLDPAAVVTVPGIAGKDKVEASSPGLTAAKMKVTVMSKAGVDKEAKDAEAKAAKEAAAKPAAKPAAGNPGEEVGEEMGEAMGKAFAGMFGGMMGGMSGGPNSETLLIQDPDSKLIKVEFVNAAGKVIESQGRMSMNTQHVYEFEKPLPAGASLRLYVATPKAMVQAPFALKDVILP